MVRPTINHSGSLQRSSLPVSWYTDGSGQRAHQPAEGPPGEGEAGDKDADEHDQGVGGLLGDGGSGEGQSSQRCGSSLHDEHGHSRHIEQRLTPKPGTHTTCSASSATRTLVPAQETV